MKKSIFPAFETILLKDGNAQNLSYHESRLNATRTELYGCADKISLANINFGNKYSNARAKLIYMKEITSLEIVEYHKKPISKFRLVTSDIHYEYKMQDRSELDILFASKGDADDVLIIQNGLFTDTSIANVAFWIDGEWLTPAKPLLKGTMRQKLLDEGILQIANITKDELSKISKIAIMNALRGFEVIEKPILIEF